MTEDTINKLLDSQGFQCEPGIGATIDEHMPISLYAGSIKLWVAETAVELADQYKNLRQRAGAIRDRLAEQLKNTDAKGRALIWFSKDVSDEHVGKAIEMIKGVVTRPGWGTIRKNVLVLIPKSPNLNDFVQFKFKHLGNVERQVISCVARDERYGYPVGMEPAHYAQNLHLRFSDNDEKMLPIFDVIGSAEDFVLAVCLDFEDKRFHLAGVTLTPTTGEHHIIQHIRNIVNEANVSFESASKLKSVPCLLMLYSDVAVTPDDIEVFTALYGDFAYSLRSTDFDDDELMLKSNGVFGPGKNAATSALCILNEERQPNVIHNYWASQPLVKGIFENEDCDPRSTGTLNL